MANDRSAIGWRRVGCPGRRGGATVSDCDIRCRTGGADAASLDRLASRTERNEAGGRPARNLDTFEPGEIDHFWLTESYFPEIAALVRGQCPSVDEIAEFIGACRVNHVAIPHDCIDGFLAAFWRRPAAYLEPKIRAGMSGFTLLEPHVVDRGVARLKCDLESGEWERRFGQIKSLEALDVCYRLLVTT